MKNNRLLNLTVCVFPLMLGACVSSDGKSVSADAALCNGQQVETIESQSENRTGTFTTTTDIITGECIAPAVQLLRGFEVTIDDSSYGNQINLHTAAQLLDRTEQPATMSSGKDALRWTDSFENIFRNNSYTNNADSFYTGGIDLDIEFLVTDDGVFRATTVSEDDASHLAIFGTATGQVNTSNFSGGTLRQEAYGSPRSRYNSDIKQANFLAFMLANTYAKLADGGAMTGEFLGNHAELYDKSPTSLKSFFSREVFVIRSFIYHNRMDYDLLERLDVPLVSTWNAKWSPFGDENRDPAQTLMSRSYNIDYEDGANSNSLTYLETWSGSHTLDARTSIRATGHYGGDFNVEKTSKNPGSEFSISCSQAQSGCELATARNAGVAAYVKGFAPTRVEMEMNNDWALGHTAVVIASFSDWDSDSRTESPMRTNPNPLWGFVEPDR